ncbi:hypothetical protein AAF712_010505 [Marasmius tenuissimus]|uniref:Uncharacterized protein n=1 Tax=Marasmius tenuissimus TaxID=585030 RepID=A0ABR2ZN22_9AGAR
MANHFASYNNAGLARVAALHTRWVPATPKGAPSSQCQELNALHSQAVDGASVKIPDHQASPPPRPEGSEPLSSMPSQSTPKHSPNNTLNQSQYETISSRPVIEPQNTARSTQEDTENARLLNLLQSHQNSVLGYANSSPSHGRSPANTASPSTLSSLISISARSTAQQNTRFSVSSVRQREPTSYTLNHISQVKWARYPPWTETEFVPKRVTEERIRAFYRQAPHHLDKCMELSLTYHAEDELFWIFSFVVSRDYPLPPEWISKWMDADPPLAFVLLKTHPPYEETKRFQPSPALSVSTSSKTLFAPPTLLGIASLVALEKLAAVSPRCPSKQVFQPLMLGCSNPVRAPQLVQ